MQNGHEIGLQKPDPGHRVPHPPFTFKVGQFSGEHSMLYSTGVAQPGVITVRADAFGLKFAEIRLTSAPNPRPARPPAP